MQEFVTHSREETVAVGRELAKTLPAGALIAFTGGLGAGKTAFCQVDEISRAVIRQKDPVGRLPV